MAAFFSIFSPRKPQAERLSALLYHHGFSSSDPPMDDSTFDQIAAEMRSNELEEEWIRRPRTYWILTQIKKLDLMDAFIFNGYDDTFIPYNSLKALPRTNARSFNYSDAQAFLEWQRVCVSQRLQFERGEHVRLEDGDVLFEDNKKKLGSGSQM